MNCPDHQRELTGPERRCPFCRGQLVDAERFASLARNVPLAPESREDSVAFVKVRVCPDCKVPMLPWRIAELEAWVERCPSCEARWVESADLRSFELVSKRAARAKAWTSMPAEQRQEIAADLAQSTAQEPDELASELRGGELVKALFGIPIIDRARGEFSPHATLAVVLAVGVAFALGLSQPGDTFFASYAWQPTQGLSLTLLTAPWVHLGWGHFLGNVFFLWPFGDLVERRVGAARFLALYLLAGVLSTVAEGLVSGPQATIGGASGAIFALMGAAVILQRQASMKVTVPGLVGAYRVTSQGATHFPALRVPLWVGVGLYAGLQVLLLAFGSGEGLALVAHLAGLGLGLGGALAWQRLTGSSTVAR